MVKKELKRLTANGSRCVWLFLDGTISAAAQQLPVSEGILICQQKPSKVKIEDKKVEFLHYINAAHCLGKTYKAIIMADVGAITPNAYCQISESLQKGGVLCVIAPSDFSAIKMQAHNRFKSALFPEVRARLLRRAYRLVKNYPNVVTTDAECSVLMPAPVVAKLPTSNATKTEIDDAPVASDLGLALELCATADQKQCLATLDIKAANGGSVVAVTAARGRGKSAVLGIFSALAATRGSNVFVTAPYLENCLTLMEFCRKSFSALGWSSDGRDDKPTRVKARSPDHKTVHIAYSRPGALLEHVGKERSNSLVIIDEAAGIPSPLLSSVVQFCKRQKATLILASTIAGYEGTGRSFNLKLLSTLTSAALISLETPIRYCLGDPLEQLTNELFLLDSLQLPETTTSGAAKNAACNCMAVDKDLLFSGSEESWLRKIVGVFIDSHYKNSPNDLLLLADSPAHHIAVAIDPSDNETVLCALQYAYDGALPVDSRDGATVHGDLISWKLDEWHRPLWSRETLGIRIVRIATTPAARRRGVAKQLVGELAKRLGASASDLGKQQQPALLAPLEEHQLLPAAAWLGTSFGLTPALYKFWASCGFRLVHMATTPNDVTGELSCIMLAPSPLYQPVVNCIADFRSRFLRTLHMEPESHMPATFVAEILLSKGEAKAAEIAGSEQLAEIDLSRLLAYVQGDSDRAICRAALPAFARILFSQHGERLTPLQATILSGIALQCRSPDALAKELNLPSGEVVLSQLRKTIGALLSCVTTAHGKRAPSAEASRNKRQALLERYRKIEKQKL